MATIKKTALIIGAGTGGYPCAIRLGQLGVDTMIVERDEPGSVPHVGAPHDASRPQAIAEKVQLAELAAELDDVAWTCTASPGSTCTATGTGDIVDTIDLAAGGFVSYTATGTVDSGFVGDLLNTAEVASGPGVVADVRVAPGDQVDAHHVLVTFETEDAAP